MGANSIRVMPVRANIRAEYGKSPSRVVCKDFPGLAAPAKIHLLPLQAVDVCAGEKKDSCIACVGAHSETVGHPIPARSDLRKHKTLLEYIHTLYICPPARRY